MTTALDRPPFSTTPPRRLSEAELQARHQAAFPEAAGPAIESESGEMRFGVDDEALARIGPVPHLLDPGTRDRENREREARWAALSPVERAALEDVRRMIREELRRA